MKITMFSDPSSPSPGGSHLSEEPSDFCTRSCCRKEACWLGDFSKVVVKNMALFGFATVTTDDKSRTITLLGFFSILPFLWLLSFSVSFTNSVYKWGKYSFVVEELVARCPISVPLNSYCFSSAVRPASPAVCRPVLTSLLAVPEPARERQRAVT